VGLSGAAHSDRARAEPSTEFPVVVERENDLAPMQGPPSFLDEAIATDAAAAEELVDFERPLRWQALVGALLLNRSDPEKYRLSRVFRILGPSFFGRAYFDGPLHTFDFPLSASVDVALRRRGNLADVDFRYFGVQQSNARIGPVNGVWESSFPWSTDSPVTVQASLASSLQSAEFNLRREAVADIAILTGFRYVQFREVMISKEEHPSIDSYLRYDWRAQNELFGWQVGVDSQLLTIGSKFRFDAAAKAGVFGNAASSRLFNELGFGGDSNGYGWNAYRANVAFVGDVSLAAVFQITPHMALRGGYQLLWLSGVATATDELQNLDNEYFRTYTDSHVFFHGAMVGLEGTW
jgi:hypothetical protein